jgi:UDP:flavonoid glycosyltransferase YjiC (YdhE family)
MPYDGHFNPLIGIAMHFKSLGHDVRWYSGSCYGGKLQKLGIPHYPFKKALDFNQNNVNEYFPERVKLNSQLQKLKYDLKTSFILRSTEFYEDIREINASWSFDVLVCDIAFTGLPYVKELLNKKVVSIGVIPLTENSRDLPPAGLAMHPSTSFCGRRKQDFLRMFADRVIFRESSVLMNKQFKEYGVQTALGNLFDVHG